MKTTLIELHYLPCIAYFSALASTNQVLVEKYEHYEKQSFRNRCHLRGPHKVETLIIPITSKTGKPLVCEVKIDYSQKWLNNHWRTIRTGYGKAPFFEYYAPELEELLFRRPVFLYDLNLQLMTLCLKWLKQEVTIKETRVYEKNPPAGVLDLRGAINPKKEEGCNRFYKSTHYHQVFGSKFVPNLSLIDLIFNQGPDAWDIVKASTLE
ncbi:MAG TPA: WbqC family protein [Chryseosolibacter sp.]